MEAQYDPEAFLKRWGIALSELPGFAPAVAGDGFLCLVGSITEGLANEESDVDLLYCGSGVLLDKVVLEIDSSLNIGVSHDQRGREINVEQIQVADLARYADSVTRSLNTVKDPRKGNRMYIEYNPATISMLHRIKTSIPLVNGDVLRSWQEKMHLDEFHKFVCLTQVQNVMNQKEDVVGEVEAGNLDSAVWMIRSMTIGALAAAMLTSIGETNARVKWHRRLLDRHAEALGRENVDRLLTFAGMTAEEMKRDPVGQLLAVSEPILDSIMARERDVRRAALAFSLGVRYTNPAIDRRWERTVPA